jgi:hypothetical protein
MMIFYCWIDHILASKYYNSVLSMLYTVTKSSIVYFQFWILFTTSFFLSHEYQTQMANSAKYVQPSQNM